MQELTGVVIAVSRDAANNRQVTITLDLQPGQVAKSSFDILSEDYQLDQRVLVSIDNA